MLQPQTIAILFTLLLPALANPLPNPNPNPNPAPLSPDPAGAKNIGNGKGTQFIGGACLSQADCASACCATLNGAGICSGLGAQFQAGKTGCGFGGTGTGTGTAAAPATSSAVAVAAAAPPAGTSTATAAAAAGGSSTAGTINTSLPGSQNVGKADGSQFITGQCFSNADCASGCCAGLDGAAVCSGVDVGNANGKTGCGFTLSGAANATSSSSSSSSAGVAVVNAASSSSASSGGAAAAAAGSKAGTINPDLAGSQNVGKRDGSQFITGQCFSNADCASACCAGLDGAGQCSGPDVAHDAGKTGCGFTVA